MECWEKCKHGWNCCINVEGKYLEEENKIYFVHIVLFHLPKNILNRPHPQHICLQFLKIA